MKVKKFTVEEVDNIRIDEDSRPEHAWCQIAHSTEDSNGQIAWEGSELLTDISWQDLDNAKLMQTHGRSPAGLSVRFESSANPQIIAPDEYRKLTRGLNNKQRAMIMYHHDWC